jgi:hypothetical protein
MRLVRVSALLCMWSWVNSIEKPARVNSQNPPGGYGPKRKGPFGPSLLVG